ncbi:DUF5819 family protein [Kitasatospora sp. NBC_01287]|uniref:DUF5819 family protein n=1 Tax=Kitasatospora sp. NBC_01287 TaxID=2903573 RepID=UPI0022587CDE|nr:DUF5819 family protein [Kitasatospora sp. NBC_01287]MCX4747715.1 DUF5819 family protein [Kitasatospora sp. NBC_01287]
MAADEDGSGDPVPGRAWSRPAQVVLVAAGTALVTSTAVFLGLVFLSVAPSNSLSQRYQGQVDGLVYPEFEQNWKLFAPDPLQQNISVDARLRSAAGDGAWIGLTAQDIAAIRGNPVPSHVDQNLLRRAWDFYDSTHGSDESPIGQRGALAQEYLKRIALQRLGPTLDGAPVTGVELRAVTTAVAPPPWSTQRWSTAPQYRELPWWPVSVADYRGLS